MPAEHEIDAVGGEHFARALDRRDKGAAIFGRSNGGMMEREETQSVRSRPFETTANDALLMARYPALGPIELRSETTTGVEAFEVNRTELVVSFDARCDVMTVAFEGMEQTIPEIVESGNVVIAGNRDDRAGQTVEPIFRGEKFRPSPAHREIAGDEHRIGSKLAQGLGDGIGDLVIDRTEMRIGEVGESEEEIVGKSAHGMWVSIGCFLRGEDPEAFGFEVKFEGCFEADIFSIDRGEGVGAASDIDFGLA